MLCMECKRNPAVIKVPMNYNGNIVNIALCKQCAMSLGILKPNNILAEAFGLLEEPEKRCKYCGTSFEDFSQTGYLGCPKCYEAFAREIAPTIRKIHGNVRHVGRSGVGEGLNLEMEELAQRLEEAKKANDFVLAQQIYDRMQAIRGGKKNA